MFRAVCLKCGKRLKGPDTLAGKKCKCPACHTVMTVPMACDSTCGTEPLGKADRSVLHVQDRAPVRAKLTDKDLPSNLFIGVTYGDVEIDFDAKGGFEGGFAGGDDDDGNEYMKAWTCRTDAEASLSRLKDPPKCQEISKSKLLRLLMIGSNCQWLILDPYVPSSETDEYFLAKEDPNKFLSLDDVDAVRSTIIEMQGDVAETLMPFVRQMSDIHKEMKPHEVMLYADKVSGTLLGKIFSGQKAGWSSEEDSLLDVLRAANVGIVRMLDEDRVPFVCEVDKGEGLSSEWAVAYGAWKSCPPPRECQKCGESNWKFISKSPKGKSATWKCSYCGKKEIAKAGHAQTTSSCEGREPISKMERKFDTLLAEAWRKR